MIGISWKGCYATGVACFDGEHKQLVGLLDEYFRALREQRGEQVVGQTLETLLAYCASHFSHEEKLMAQHGYPRYQDHRLEHLKMTATVKGFKAMLAESRQDREDILLAFRSFLRDWLLHHIVEEDHKYGPFFCEKGIS